MFRVVLLSGHAWGKVRRGKMPIEMVLLPYEDPDDTRSSDHDELREIRTRWFGDEAIEVVVDTLDGRVVTVWRRGPTP